MFQIDGGKAEARIGGRFQKFRGCGLHKGAKKRGVLRQKRLERNHIGYLISLWNCKKADQYPNSHFRAGQDPEGTPSGSVRHTRHYIGSTTICVVLSRHTVPSAKTTAKTIRMALTTLSIAGSELR